MPDPATERSRGVLRVTEGELQRVLLDLHDGPVQYMYAGLSQLELLDARLVLDPPDIPGARDRLARVRRLLESALAEIRTSIGQRVTKCFNVRASVEGRAVGSLRFLGDNRVVRTEPEKCSTAFAR